MSIAHEYEEISFSKYHGCGNDFIIIKEDAAVRDSYSELAKRICHRTLGIGADGLIVARLKPLEMIIYNSDGSRAPMCGNGIRCFAKYCYDENICTERKYSVKTLAGNMIINIVEVDPFLIEVNMGKPDFKPKKSGINTDRKDFFKQNLQLESQSVEVSSCFMGTVHTVVWLNNLDNYDLEKFGGEISNHPIFTEKTNVNMARIINRNTIQLQTYERGAGLTYACGTGACACLVIGIQQNMCENEIDVILPYGKLHIKQDLNSEVIMTGPAEKIGQGFFVDKSNSSCIG